MPLEGDDTKYPPANAGEYKPASESDGTGNKLPPVPTPPPTPEPPSSTSPPDKESSKWRENTKLGFEIGGLLILLVYTIFSGLQWAQIRWTNRLTREALNSSGESLERTLTKMQKQVDAADTANRETHNLLAATQGAFFQIVVEVSQKDGLYGYLSVRAINGGKTSATKFSGESTMLRTDLTGKTIQFERRKFLDSTIPTNSASTILFTVDNPPANYMVYRHETFKVITTIAFDDGFGDRRTETVCREMVEISTQTPGFVECGNAQDWEKLAEH